MDLSEEGGVKKTSVLGEREVLRREVATSPPGISVCMGFPGGGEMIH